MTKFFGALGIVLSLFVGIAVWGTPAAEAGVLIGDYMCSADVTVTDVQETNGVLIGDVRMPNGVLIGDFTCNGNIEFTDVHDVNGVLIGDVRANSGVITGSIQSTTFSGELKED